jgi:3-oxoacyl-[acyl-carrier-protein] synthase-3
MKADFGGILKNGLGLASETWQAFQKEMGLKKGDVDRIFTHQVSVIHKEMLFKTLAMDESKGFSTVEYLGNIGLCALPISFSIAVEEGRVKTGDKVLMMAGGSGLASIMVGLRW